jgi:ElaB/YqjD/DUF883 family membrane-anchored ribosome-binding protein
MARTKALNITLAGGSTKAQLAEIYKAVIDNINVTAVSSNLKNTNLSGDPNAGSVEVKRFANSTAKDYGTARAAGKGDALVEEPIVINIDKHKEIVEEFENSDIAMYGVPSLLAKRAANHVETLARTLDTVFFETAVTAGTEFTPTKTKKVQILEELVAAIEATKSQYVDGVDRADIAVTVTSAWASELRNELDDLPNGMNYTNGLVGQLHGFDVYVSNRLPEGVDAVAMRYDSVAQPCMVNQYKEEKIPLSDATAVELFFYYGTKAVTGDLIKYVGTAG